MNQFESDADAGEILIGIITAFLIWIQHRERGRRAFVGVRQMMIGDDDVESVCACPVQGLMRGYSAINADNQFVALAGGFLQSLLTNPVAFSEAMRDVVAGRSAQHAQRAQQHGRPRRPVHIIVAVNQDWLMIVDCLKQTRDGV